MVAMRKSGPSVSRAGRIPFPDAQSPDLTVVVVVVVVGSCLMDDMMDARIYSVCIFLNDFNLKLGFNRNRIY